MLPLAGRGRRRRYGPASDTHRPWGWIPAELPPPPAAQSCLYSKSEPTVCLSACLSSVSVPLWAPCAKIQGAFGPSSTTPRCPVQPSAEAWVGPEPSPKVSVDILSSRAHTTRAVRILGRTKAQTDSKVDSGGRDALGTLDTTPFLLPCPGRGLRGQGNTHLSRTLKWLGI